MMMGVMPSALAVNEDVEGKVVVYTSIYQFVIDMMDGSKNSRFGEDIGTVQTLLRLNRNADPSMGRCTPNASPFPAATPAVLSLWWPRWSGPASWLPAHG